MNIKKLTDYKDPSSLGSRMRMRRLKPLTDMITSVFKKRGRVSILDVGGRETYWHAIPAEFLKENSVEITILNLPCELVTSENSFFRFVTGDACNLAEYADNSFDIIHSNSVIEHVGNWDRIKMFAKEAKRLAPNIFMQTPYFWFPIEPHYVKLFHHWIPRPIRTSMWMKFNIEDGSRKISFDEAVVFCEEEPYLLDVRSYRFLFPGCVIFREKFFTITKSLIALRYE